MLIKPSHKQTPLVKMGHLSLSIGLLSSLSFLTFLIVVSATEEANSEKRSEVFLALRFHSTSLVTSLEDLRGFVVILLFVCLLVFCLLFLRLDFSK